MDVAGVWWRWIWNSVLCVHTYCNGASRCNLLKLSFCSLLLLTLSIPGSRTLVPFGCRKECELAACTCGFDSLCRESDNRRLVTHAAHRTLEHHL